MADWAKSRPEFSDETPHRPFLWHRKPPEVCRHDSIIELLLCFQHLLWCWAGGLEPESKGRTFLWTVDFELLCFFFAFLPCKGCENDVLHHKEELQAKHLWGTFSWHQWLNTTLANLESRNYKGCTWLCLCPLYCTVLMLRYKCDYKRDIQKKFSFSFSHFYCNDEFYGKVTEQSKRKQKLDEVLLYIEFQIWPDEINGPACDSCITIPS